MTIRAYAKINLDLRLGKRRADGFHPIDTLMIRVDVYDTLEAQLSPDGNISLQILGDERLTPGPDNLVIRAAHALQKYAPSAQGAILTLRKHIPQGAGLGGGSSDAAATLHLLSKWWNLQVPDAKLAEIGATLGSDVPFFLQPYAARGTGRGEILQPIPLRNLPWAVLLHPGFGSPTADAYASYALDPQPGPRGPVFNLDRVDGPSLEIVPQNDLEPAVEKKFLWIQVARRWMEKQPGARVARMSGSGSTVFGLFRNKQEAESAREKALQYFGTKCWLQVAQLLSGPSGN